MQLQVNKARTRGIVKVYDGYDREKRRAKVKRVGSIGLLPTAPTSIPPPIATQLTPEQQRELLGKLAAIRTQQLASANQQALSAALAAMDALVNAIRGGLVVDEASAEALRVAVGQALGGAAQPLPRPLSGNPVEAVLDAVNVLVDSVRGGQHVDAALGADMAMALAMVQELLAGLPEPAL